MLYSLFHNNTDAQAHKWVHYFPIYERYLKDFVHKSIVMIEIGVAQGGSLKMWKKYLGPFATIIGIDINPESQKYEDQQCKVHIGDQSDLAFLASIIKRYGRPDIVIDDGSHTMDDMNKTFQFLYPLLNNNGVYLVEDAHACYCDDYGGGLKKENTFIEKAKDMIDSLHAFYIEDHDMVTDFTKTTFSISFYDSIVAFEKRARGIPYDLYTGNPDL